MLLLFTGAKPHHIKYWDGDWVDKTPPWQAALCGCDEKGGHIFEWGLERVGSSANELDWSTVCSACLELAAELWPGRTKFHLINGVENA